MPHSEKVIEVSNFANVHLYPILPENAGLLFKNDLSLMYT